MSTQGLIYIGNTGTEIWVFFIVQVFGYYSNANHSGRVSAPVFSVTCTYGSIKVAESCSKEVFGRR